MSSVAELLRAAREAHGFSVEQVADITKLKGDHVRALEEGNYDYFAAPVYIRGFARTYGRLVHVEEKLLMAQLDLELSRTERFNAPPSLTGQAQGPLDKVLFLLSRIHWKIVLPLLLVLGLAGGAVWLYRNHRDRQSQDPLKQLGTGMYQGPAKAPPTLPLPAPKR